MEHLDFKLINQPLRELTNQIISQLKNENNEPSRFYDLLESLLIISFQTYKAICRLVSKDQDPKYPTQAHILGRSLIDTFFSIAVLVENPEEYSRRYELAGYRFMWKEYAIRLESYGNDPEWKSDLDERKKLLDLSAEVFKLSEDEKSNPSKYRWPTPYKMLECKMVSNEKEEFLKEVYKWRYSLSSEWSHMSWGGMALGIFATMPDHHWYPGKLESDAVYTGILFLLMILSEIEANCNYGAKQKLRYIWTILKTVFGEAADYYRLRYDTLLQEK